MTKRDVAFLQKWGLMDYSLVVSYHGVPRTHLDVARSVYAGTSDGGSQPYIAASKDTLYISYVGIIDFLQDWTCAKKVAMCVKCCECNKATIPPVCLCGVLFFVVHRTPPTRRPGASSRPPSTPSTRQPARNVADAIARTFDGDRCVLRRRRAGSDCAPVPVLRRCDAFVGDCAPCARRGGGPSDVGRRHRRADASISRHGEVPREARQTASSLHSTPAGVSGFGGKIG